MARILLIEDKKEVRETLQHFLKVEGYDVEAVETAEQGLALEQERDFDLVVTDFHLPGGRCGLEVIDALHEKDPLRPVILMTGHHSTNRVIEATLLGAYDYIPKPVDFKAFLQKVQKALKSRFKRVEICETTPDTECLFEEKDMIIGQSDPMLEVYKEIGRIATKPVDVLIRGETGTGKELVARILHQKSKREPFVAVNCAAIPENLLESEFFGHEPGAFTDAKTRRIGKFEQANKGTIFLDEIGDMSPVLQQKLLRVLHDKTIYRVGGKEPITVDVRVIAATHRDLESAIDEKQFRQDLYYRLSDAVIFLPPLRDRRDDIPLLVKYFLRKYGPELGAPRPSISPNALQYLTAPEQIWPGNVRQLENAIRRALVLAGHYIINREIVEKAVAQTRVIEQTIQKFKHAESRINGTPQSNEEQPDSQRAIARYVAELLAKAITGELENIQAMVTEEVERELFGQAIRLAKGNQSHAAKWLGISLPTMREKLNRYGLHPSQTTA